MEEHLFKVFGTLLEARENHLSFRRHDRRLKVVSRKGLDICKRLEPQERYELNLVANIVPPERYSAITSDAPALNAWKDFSKK